MRSGFDLQIAGVYSIACRGVNKIACKKQSHRSCHGSGIWWRLRPTAFNASDRRCRIPHHTRICTPCCLTAPDSEGVATTHESSIVRPRPRPKAARVGVVEREAAVTETPPAAPTLPRRRDLDEGGGNLWEVLLHNDDIHTFDYTIQALAKCVPSTRKKAHTIVVEVHSKGMARVWRGWKSRAKMICSCLQYKGLTSTIAPAEGPL